MLAINYEHRVVGVTQRGVACWADKLAQMLGIAGSHDEQLHVSSAFRQIIEDAAMHRNRLDPKVWIAPPPRGQPAGQLGVYPVIALGDCLLVAGWGWPAGDPPQRRVTQARLVPRPPQHDAVVGGLVGFDDDPPGMRSGWTAK